MSKFKIGDYVRITNPLDPNFNEIGVVGNITGPFSSPAIYIIEMRLRSGLFSISEQELTLSTQAEYWAQIVKFNPGFTITAGSVNTGSTITAGSVNTGSTPQAFQVGDRVEVINPASLDHGFGGEIIQINSPADIIVNIDITPNYGLVATRTCHFSETDLIKVNNPAPTTTVKFNVGDRVEVINPNSFAYGYGGKIIQIINRNFIVIKIDTIPGNMLKPRGNFHFSETDLIKVSIPTHNTSSSVTSNTTPTTFTSPDNTQQVVFPEDRIVFTKNSVQKCICNMRDLMMNGCESTRGMKCNSVK